MKIFKKVFFIMGALWFLTSLAHGEVEQSTALDSYKSSFILKGDYTYTNTFEIIKTASTFSDAFNLQIWSFGFLPAVQTLEILDAYVVHKDGTKIPVTSENIFTRPTKLTEESPHFNASYEISVVFPQIFVGSCVYIKAKLTQIKSDPLGFSHVFSPPYLTGIKDFQVCVTLPKSLHLNWKKQGPFQVEDKVEGGSRIIKANLKNMSPYMPENSMGNFLEFAPFFIVSSISAWEDIGKILYKAWQEQAAPPQFLKNLSDKIVQGKKGKEAVDAIYMWVVSHIGTVKSALTSDSILQVHPLEEILKNEIGDAKDKVYLMQALLKAQEIESFPVLAGALYKSLPLATPLQFTQILLFIADLSMFTHVEEPLTPLGILENLGGTFSVIGNPEGKSLYLPVSKAEDNVYEDKNILEISSDGTVRGTNTLHVRGEFDSWLRREFAENSPRDVAQNILNQTRQGGEGSFELLGNPQDSLRPFSVQGVWTSPDAISLREQAYFWIPVGLDGMNFHVFRQAIMSQKRLYPFVGSPSQFYWTYKILIPKEYQVEYLPKNRFLENPAGSYKGTYVQKGNNIIVTRAYKVDKFYFSPQEYEDMLLPLLQALEAEVHAVVALQKKK